MKKIRLRDVIFPEFGVVSSIESVLGSKGIINYIIDMKAFSIKSAEFKLQCVQCVVRQ